MSALAKLSVSSEVQDAIQSSLPKGQIIRHLVLVFEMGSFQEYFLIATDSLVAIRGLKWDWDLSADQQRSKEKLEKNTSFLTKGLKWVERNSGKSLNKNPLGETVERANGQLNEKIMGLLAAKYGPLNIKWLPHILWSKDFLISEFSFNSYEELTGFDQASKAFSGRGHQTDLFAHVEYSGNDGKGWLWSFFSELRDIYDHVRDRKLQGSNPVEAMSLTTKCQSCGSTELTIRGTYLVCDYCQSKYAR